MISYADLNGWNHLNKVIQNMVYRNGDFQWIQNFFKTKTYAVYETREKYKNTSIIPQNYQIAPDFANYQSTIPPTCAYKVSFRLAKGITNKLLSGLQQLVHKIVFIERCSCAPLLCCSNFHAISH